MPDQSPILSLPLILPAQAQKHVTHNEALRLLDVIVQLAVLNRTLSAEPALPAVGDRHIVAAGAVGAWAGQTGKVALYTSTGWQFFAPLAGWQAHVLAEGTSVVYSGTTWALPTPASSVPVFGVNATADTTNRLSVQSTATLFSNVGAGHQVKVNKAAVGDTASLLFQTGFSGRAEMGLAGNDGFSIKVSADGTAFTQALSVDPTAGSVRLAKPALLTGQATDPASPANGTIWHNSTSGEIKVRAGGATQVVGGGGVTDGDKGDITVSGAGAAWAIDAGSVTLAKMASVATGSILGRSTAGTGAPEVLTSLQARGVLNVADGATANSSDAALLARANHTGTQPAVTISDFSAAVAATAAVTANTAKISNATHTGEVTGAAALTITPGAVTLAKQADVATGTVFYRKSAATGAPEVQPLATLKTDLGLTGANTGDQTITLTGDVTGSGTGSFASTIAAAAVTLGKMANVATGTIFYRKSAASGVPEVQTIATLKADLGLTGTNSGDQASIVGITGTKAQFNTAISDGDIQFVGDAPTTHLHVAAAITDFDTAVAANPAVAANTAKVTNATHTGDVTGTTALTLATVNANVGVFGSATAIPTLTINAKGLTTAVADVAIAIPSGQVTDFIEAAQDAIGAMVNTSLVYTDATPLLQRAALTGDVTAAVGSNATTIANDAVSNAKLANMNAATIKGNNTGAAADPVDLTGTQTTAMLDTFTSALKGLVPASGGGTTTFLRADGTFAAPASGGTPGGASGKVQFNNAAAFDGAANVEIDSGNLKLLHAADPAAPTGGAVLYGQSVAGRSVAKLIGPVGIAQVLQGALHGAAIFAVGPSNTTTAPTVIGGSLTTATTISHVQTIASANKWQATRRTRFQTSITAGNASGVRTAYGQWFAGNAVGFGGFFFRAQFGMNINLAGGQKFCGLAFASTAIAGDPSGLLNMCGMGYDAADSSAGNWQFMRNDGTGVATKVDLGTGAARNTNDGYDLMMFVKPNSTELFVRIVNLQTGSAVLDTSYTIDVPAVNTALTFKCEVRNGAVAAADNIELAKAYIENDF